MLTKEQFIVQVWEGLGSEVVGASELGLIGAALVERFGSALSPAAIARVLADHGARLGHPEILRADALWRETQLLFTAEDLDLANLEAATKFINKVEHLRKRFQDNPPMHEHLRQTVRQLKTDLQVVAGSHRAGKKTRELAQEVAQWLSVWLQNPPIFAEWLALRQNTPEFRDRFLA